MGNKLTDDFVGLIMIVAALLAIFMVVTFDTLDNYNSRASTIDKSARTIVRLLTNMPMERFIKNDVYSNSVLELLSRNEHNADLAYVAKVNLSGESLASVTVKNIIIPDMVIGSWPKQGVSKYVAEQGSNKYIEYRAPIMSGKELVGYERVGYDKPKIELQFSDVSFYAKMALPVFLLVPVFYLMFRRETRSLRQVSSQILSFMDVQSVKLDTDSDNKDIIANLRQFVLTVGKQMDALKNEQAQAQESTLILGYQKKRIESVLQSFPDAVVVMDENGAITYENGRLQAVMGLQPEGIIGLMPNEWCTDEQVINLLSSYHSNITSSKRVEVLEFTPEAIPNKTISVSAYPLFSPTGLNTVLGTLVLFHDITKKVLLTSKHEDFINHVSHEMKSPLNVIQMCAETLLDNNDDDKVERTQSLNMIMDEAERLNMLVSTLLNISKIESGHLTLNKQRVRLGDLIKDTFEDMVSTAEINQVNFKLGLPSTIGAVSIDKDLVRIALRNLLTNALKYSDIGGNVTLQVDDDSDKYVLSVIDDGIGIAEKDLLHVFDKFYRADSDKVRQRNGHGLGLSLSKNIIEMHQGRILVESILGQGTTFRIMLPKQAVFINEMG
ncbi:MAG: ATP-binding protein [Pseudomonadota bacterium]|nr:ATP-binding protein [Pseudomonadota bacterium]MDO7710076.1 ATP-binding protein [Pseudomonadota bacterium]